MRIFDNPAGECVQKLGKLYYEGYGFNVVDVQENIVTLIVYGKNNTIFGVRLTDEEENESLENEDQ